MISGLQQNNGPHITLLDCTLHVGLGHQRLRHKVELANANCSEIMQTRGL